VLPAINASLYASYYFPQTYDQIVRYPTGRIVDGLTAATKANIGDGFIQGVELGAEWRFYPEHRRQDYRYLGSGGNEPGTNVVLGGQLFFLERVPQKAFRNKTV